jgi:hypothetical protein
MRLSDQPRAVRLGNHVQKMGSKQKIHGTVVKRQAQADIMLDETMVLQHSHISILAEYRCPTGDTVEIRQDGSGQISKRRIQSGIDVDPPRGN